MIAAREGDLGMTKLFVARGIDVNAQGDNGWTALMWATQWWVTRKSVSYLLDARADGVLNGQSRLEAARTGSSVHLAARQDQLMDALGWATASGHKTIADLLSPVVAAGV